MSRRNSSFSWVLLALVVSGLVWCSTAKAAANLDTTPGGTSGLSPFGGFLIMTVGQSITVPPVDHVLTSITFYLDDFQDPGPVNFDAYVYAWNGSRLIGPELFSAGPFSTTNNGGNGGPEALTIDTGNLALTPGGQYMLLFSTTNEIDSVVGTAAVAFNPFNDYSDGEMAILNNGADFSQLFTQDWFSIGADADMSFRATFVPEPSSLVMAGMGCLGLALMAWNRRRSLRQ